MRAGIISGAIAMVLLFKTGVAVGALFFNLIH